MSASMWLYRRFPRITHYWRRVAGANREREMDLLPDLCDRSQTGIDVGAKVGMYTYRIRAHSADVVAFEPIPMFNRMLSAVFDGKRGRIEPYAVSSQPGKVTMRLPYDSKNSQQFGRATIEPANALKSEKVARVEEIEVETRTLDSYQFAQVGFIKIDVEGHELAVLDGATATLATARPNMLIECNSDHVADGPKKLQAWLDDHDYQAVFLDGKQLRPIETYRHEVHWSERGIENFVCVHRSRTDVIPRLTQRVAR